MTLLINTTLENKIIIALYSKDKVYQKTSSAKNQAGAKVLELIENLLKEQKLDWSHVKGIELENRGGSFSSLRTGVAIANALAYAKQIPLTTVDKKKVNKWGKIEIASALYDREPNIGQKKPCVRAVDK